MQNNDLTFFTNEPERNLYDRFCKILKSNTQFFDVLVGYFRTSGFHLLQDSLDEVEKTRILIGINTDKQVVEMLKESKDTAGQQKLSSMETTNNYKNNIKIEFENSDDTKEVEDGVNKFIDFIKKGKLEVRVYPRQQIHSKVYIMRKDQKKSEDYGKVITGSSNFSQAGLVNNLEFNVELKNAVDVRFALEKFEELWKESIDVSEDCVETVSNDTWVKGDITPYEMYVKFLYEYFKEEINDDLYDITKDPTKYFPLGFKPLKYQRDAILEAKRNLEAYNGVFISDVVGLGKTYICAMLAQELSSKKLIICPPILIDYWQRVMEDFGVGGVHVESVGKLDKIIEDGVERYKYVFIDESHKFRNNETENYKMLHEICFKRKVVLISATPQNNYSTDIANQIYLFQPKNNSNIIPNIKNIEEVFNRLQAKLKKFEKGTDEYKKASKEISEYIRDKVLRHIMIRRTRTEIQKIYGDDLKEQGLEFPKLNKPERLIYEFDTKTEDVFEKTIEKIVALNYSRYKPLMYVIKDELTPMQRTLLGGQVNMGGFMKDLKVVNMHL